LKSISERAMIQGITGNRATPLNEAGQLLVEFE
jgi:hypothetical protein